MYVSTTTLIINSHLFNMNQILPILCEQARIACSTPHHSQIAAAVAAVFRFLMVILKTRVRQRVSSRVVTMRSVTGS